ncbi:MAG: NAD-dependent epimerase/dehydratase family protein [Sterolibacteriaceae bacterium MAG5]|nr:NAD-dependent epimerase/dehydratase family protein [Candidatus Nitricoxidireducens bremensis]
MIVAITGARGFIGRPLAAAHAARGDEVRILTRRQDGTVPASGSHRTFIGDLTAADGIPAGFLDGVDVLYHCAGELRDESLMESVNLAGTRRLLEAAAGRIGRWVHLSSVGVYGPYRAGEVREDAPLNPVNAYERSKAAADRLVSACAEKGAFEWSMLRPSIVFGPDMPNPSLRQLAAAVRRGLFFFIGAPGATANYIHVDNVVTALMLCGTHAHAAGQVFNLSDCCSFEDFIAAIAAACGVPAPTRRLPESLVRALVAFLRWIPQNPLTPARVDAMTGRASYPIDKISADLGYRHVVSMEAGIAATLGVPPTRPQT